MKSGIVKKREASVKNVMNGFVSSIRKDMNAKNDFIIVVKYKYKMDLPHELTQLVQEKWQLEYFRGHPFHELPEPIIKRIRYNELSPFVYTTETMDWVVKREDFRILECFYKDTNIWSEFYIWIIVSAVLNSKQGVLEWVDSKVEPNVKRYICLNSIICENNYRAEVFLRDRGYRLV